MLAPLPAVTANDVTVELHGSTLRLWAHVRSAGPRDFVLNEWEYGGYEREIDVPPGFGSALEASLANGQLAVRVLRGDPVDQLIGATQDSGNPTQIDTRSVSALSGIWRWRAVADRGGAVGGQAVWSIGSFRSMKVISPNSAMNSSPGPSKSDAFSPLRASSSEVK